ncbi:tRNA (N6-threonylcarbamoyladenosine(37)-N6)-methyltransferase TrmO [Gilliamella apicola]|nr:tRNA (N6-threonylcarbamoyladenosine(37)-N6)-methyltransferase TrmO [Gilliamella apicola]OTP88659.1 tRNA (N6-threonylcarbamoyladenosine(37)-N6)-methyltransferase TrmO [Gilliamella apicola]OTP92194.1 tRNA (N6-threonylcarbamoyladenosine(37)-N6)-methyltransferase TrmO [Gilliamella apicola]OTP92267.1 tRNA (N6-threonylcarbamoyladenosine(37)-N6)-methyltransferase TrmO [Gilliamella apicola]OTQ00460.1 tRNA (N6-threonylcarbamoyladenosine(37)-N6)-methyltransferase TrmO [Gilliamella apicola]OTQ03835.1 
MTYQIKPIGIIHSPYSEKFAVPRQPNLVTAGQGELHLLAPYNNTVSVKGLEQFSHLWLLFQFHHIEPEKWRLTVRPPRLGGNKTLGVFATRSPFRPNHIGLSAVELKDIVIKNKQIILKLGSIDLVDGTPIIDIKPYIPYCDSYPTAIAGYAQSEPERKITVEFSPQAQLILTSYLSTYPHLTELITQVISQDPRPAYKQNNIEQQEYGLTLYQFNIKCKISNQHAIVEDITIDKKK